MRSGAFYLDGKRQPTHLSGAFFTEGKATKNSEEDVRLLIELLEKNTIRALAAAGEADATEVLARAHAANAGEAPLLDNDNASESFQSAATTEIDISDEDYADAKWIVDHMRVTE